MQLTTPSPELLIRVRAAFVEQGSSFAKWCLENKISRQWATAALTGRRDGPRARDLRAKILKAAAPATAA
jgi:hypothetical protein